MSLADILCDDGLICDLKATSKKHLFQEMSAVIGRALDLETADVFDAILARERLGSTGIGFGVAIPHARHDGVSAVTGAFARLAAPIAFEAVDDEPVDLVFVLLAPEDQSSDHLRALARVSRAFHKAEFRDQLRGASSVDALYAILTAPPASEVA